MKLSFAKFIALNAIPTGFVIAAPPQLKGTEQAAENFPQDRPFPANDERCLETGPEVCGVQYDDNTTPRGKNFLAQANPIEPFECITFNSDDGDKEGFDLCPGHYDNIFVRHSSLPGVSDTPLSNNQPGEGFYLHVVDRSGGSLACGTGSAYTGSWLDIVNQNCYEFCWDVIVFHDGCHANVPGCEQNPTGSGYFKKIYPSIVLQGGAPNYYRAAFNANFYITSPEGDNAGWHTICAPLEQLDSTGNLPSGDDGSWNMAGAPCNILSGLPCSPTGPAPASAWPVLLSDITAIQLPVDYTGNPAERLGYDNICMVEGECKDYCDPEPLCYWKHEFNCERLKRYPWYSEPKGILNLPNDPTDPDTAPDRPPYLVELMDDLTPNVFSSKETCVCGILDNCCPDRCDMAEQELLALLMNIASSRLQLTCCVKYCGEELTVEGVIKRINRLLGETPRTEYSCSLALQLATGINADRILCDSEQK